MEDDPFVLIEGMTIAGIAVGATQGYIYLRSEYPHALHILNEAIEKAVRSNYLGENIQGSGKTFHLEVRRGAGAYVCGEETSLLESLEGKRGIVRFKPPLPAIEGLFGKPTIINNVISLATIPIILDKGSPLTTCVSDAVDGLRADGTLAALQQQWLAEAGRAPLLK